MVFVKKLKTLLFVSVGTLCIAQIAHADEFSEVTVFHAHLPPDRRPRKQRQKQDEVGGNAGEYRRANPVVEQKCLEAALALARGGTSSVQAKH